MKGKKYLIDNKELMIEYDFEKNKEINLSLITSGSEKKIWWKCPNGHSYCSHVGNRFKGVGCPICRNKQVLKGYNDLATTNPLLASEWNYDKNMPLTHKEITKGSNKKVWWKCEKGHEWEATINDKNRGTRCPVCSKNK